MPIYEYICWDCGKQFEVIRPISEADAPITCQHCKGENTRRMLSVFYASSGGRVIAGNTSGCAGCTSTSCATCKH